MKQHRDATALVLAGFLAFSPIVATGADWSQFRGPGGAGVSAGKGLPTTWSQTENLVWKTELPGAGTSSPVVFAGKIFLTAYSGYGVSGQPQGDMSDLKRVVLCLDGKTGKILWQKEVASRLPETARIREGHGYASSTPIVDAERVYVFFGKSGVFAFDHAGKQLWNTEVGSGLNGWGSATSPVLYKDVVLINASVESESLVALNRKTGKEVWRAEGIKESWATPLLVSLKGDKTEVVVPIFEKILAFDPDTGKPLWNCATNIRWYMAPSPVAHDGVVYCIGGRSGGALAVRAGGRGDVTETHRLWTGKKGSNVSSPISHDGHVYWMNDNQGLAYCAEAKTGNVVYEEKLPRVDQVYAAGLLADGKLYYTDRRGRTHVLKVGPKYEHLGVNDLSDRSIFNASPAVMGDKLLIRSDKYLYCVGKK